MYNPNDPRFRRTLNNVSQRLEVANETAQISLFSISEHCLKPCFFSVSNCLTATTNTCFPSTLRDERPGRRRAIRRPRGRLERSFDFYDDWEEDENDALLEWEADEANRLLGDEDGSGPQPQRRGIMNYGTGSTGAVIRAIGGTGAAGQRRPQRRNTGDQDPTVIPNQSLFGFLDRLPFKLGARGLRYKPSASGLQDRPPIAKDEERAAAAAAAAEGGASARPTPRSTRTRSATLDSHRTEDSLSSRGDIFPSDDEAEDAVALDDEFAARFLPDDPAARRPRRPRRRPGSSGAASASRPDSAGGRSDSSAGAGSGSGSGEASVEALRREEQRAQADEERGVAARREAAARLARRRGLGETDSGPAGDAAVESRSVGSDSRSGADT